MTPAERAPREAFPWYWRLSSALVWALLFLTFDRVFGDALRTTGTGGHSWPAPFSMLPQGHAISGIFDLVAWFLMLVAGLIFGIIMFLVLLVALGVLMVVNAAHTTHTMGLIGFGFGLMFRPSVALFGRSVDAVLAGIAGFLHMFGHSTLVEPFEKGRPWDERVWSLAPLALVLLVVFGAGPLKDRLEAGPRAKVVQHGRLREPPAGAGERSVHYDTFVSEGVPSDRDYAYTATLEGVDVRQDRMELRLKWQTWQPEVAGCTMEVPKSTHLVDESGKTYRLIGTDGQVDVGQRMPMSDKTEREATLYFDRPEDPYRAMQLVLPYWSSRGLPGQKTFAFDLREVGSATALIRRPVPAGAERVNMFVDVDVPGVGLEKEYAITLVGVDILGDRLGLHINWWNWWQVQGLTFQVPSDMYLVDKAGRRYKLVGSDKMYPGSVHKIDENIDLNGGTFYFERPADPHRVLTLVVPYTSPKGKTGVARLKCDLRKRGSGATMAGTP